MAEIVTLELPETLAQRAKQIAVLTNQRLEDVLVEWSYWVIAGWHPPED